MSPFLESIFIGLATGVAAGLVTGFYSGLVVSRFIRFHGLCGEALRSVNSVEYMLDQRRVRVDRNDVLKLPLIAAELMHYGHKKAAGHILDQHKVVANALYNAEAGQASVEDLSAALTHAYERIRNARPSYKLFVPWGRA